MSAVETLLSGEMSVELFKVNKNEVNFSALLQLFNN